MLKQNEKAPTFTFRRSKTRDEVTAVAWHPDNTCTIMHMDSMGFDMNPESIVPLELKEWTAQFADAARKFNSEEVM